jgi:hypothetical protein
MLFIGTITRLIEGDRYKAIHVPPARTAIAGVSVPPQHVVVPVIAATPVLSPHDARREWRYERRAMRDFRRAARHGYGYGQPIAIPVAHALEYYEPVQLSSRAQSEHRRDDSSEAMCSSSYMVQGQREIPPPKYEATTWDQPRTTVGR